MAFAHSKEQQECYSSKHCSITYYFIANFMRANKCSPIISQTRNSNKTNEFLSGTRFCEMRLSVAFIYAILSILMEED